MLEFKNVDFKYPEDDYEMIKGLSFKVEEGEFISIIGASGCGKSTVFRLINGLEKQQNGDITVKGIPVSQLKNYSAYMPQKDLLYPWRTIEKNICLPMELQKKSKNEMKERADEILNDVGLLDYKDKFPKDLSGGMKQRASFARTLLTGSDLLLLDEPFSALDSLTKIGLWEWLLHEWEKHRKTIMFVTHDVEEAIFLSKRILLIKDKPVTCFEEYEIPLDYPRTREVLKRRDITELKEKVINDLRQKVEI